MFLHRSHVITYVIFCLLSVISPFASAMKKQDFSSDAMKSSSALHFYGNQRESRDRTPKNTINSMPITASPASENSNKSVSALVAPPTTVIPSAETTCDQLSAIFAQLQKEPMSADERRASFLMLKHTAHEELKRSLEERSDNVVRFANLETKIFLLMEKTEQDQQPECCTLQAHCLAAQPDLDDID